MTHQEVARLFVDALRKRFADKLVSAVVFGSVATGKQLPDSDIDILLVIEDLPRGRFARRALLDGVYDEFEWLIPAEHRPFLLTVLKTPQEAKNLSPLYFDMTDRRIILHDRDDFFAAVLQDVQSRLAKLGARRKKLGQIEYWDLKPDYVPGEVFEI